MHVRYIGEIALKWHNAFSYARGNLEIMCECMT